MVAALTIDITFDFRTEATGKHPDADASSPILLRYHQLLWSKPLPSGRPFELTPRNRKPYALVHDSDVGRCLLTSDSVLATFSRRPDMRSISDKVPAAEIDALNRITSTIGGTVLWPGSQIDGKWTINQARGCIGRIADRFDLTLECIRRHYLNDFAHLLADVFGRYTDFFDLFASFAGYVDFWLLDDLVDADDDVKLFLPSDDFTLPSLPQSLADCPHLLRTDRRLRHGSELTDSAARTLTGQPSAADPASQYRRPDRLRSSCAISYRMTGCLIHRVRSGAARGYGRRHRRVAGRL